MRYSLIQFLRLNEELAAAFEARHKTGVVVVGNGRSVLATECGRAIDRFATVVRFNEYKLDEFAPHVGSKTDLWVLSDYVCVKLLNKYPERRHPVLVAIPYMFMGKPYYHQRRKELEQQMTPEQLGRVTFVSPDVAADLIERHPFGDRWPSSGLLTIWHMLAEHPQLYLHGFDFFREIDGKIHYMEDNHKANHDSYTEQRICESLGHKLMRID